MSDYSTTNRNQYVTETNRDRILDILDDEGTVDMDAREENWRSEGWSGYRSGFEGQGLEPGAKSGDVVDGTIEVVEERMRVGKRELDHGRVRVRSYVVETPVDEQVSLHDETVHVERRPVDRAVDAGGAAFAEQTLEATETVEEAVISKDARVVEEITLNKAWRTTPRPSVTRCATPRSTLKMIGRFQPSGPDSIG